MDVCIIACLTYFCAFATHTGTLIYNKVIRVPGLTYPPAEDGKEMSEEKTKLINNSEEEPTSNGH